MRSSNEHSAAARADTLARGLRVVVGKLRRKLREKGAVGDFTSPQLAALSRLDRHGAATVTALASAEGVRPQSMGATLATLQEAGVVRGKPHPTDGRQVLLSLTPAFRNKLNRGRAAREDWLSQSIDARLSPAERKTLAAALRLLERLVDS